MYNKVTVTGTSLEDFRGPTFVCQFIAGIQEALDTFSLPVNHFTLHHVACDDDDIGDDDRMPARQYLPCSSTSWQLTIDL